MSTSGKIKTLFSDAEKTEALFPRTVLNAVSDENGAGLNALLDNINSELATKVTESFVANKIAEAQLNGGSGTDIDLSGYATKDDVRNIDFPVDSVNGKTGAVNLSASDVGARPSTWTPSITEVAGFTPVQQGGGIGQKTNKVYLGWSGGDLKCTSDTYDHGSIITTGSEGSACPVSKGGTGATNAESARANLGAAAASHNHSKSQITDFPTSMPASDVYSWAKASSKPSYSWGEISGKPSTFTPATHSHDISAYGIDDYVISHGTVSNMMSMKSYDEAENIEYDLYPTITWHWRKYKNGLCALLIAS